MAAAEQLQGGLERRAGGVAEEVESSSKTARRGRTKGAGYT